MSPGCGTCTMCCRFLGVRELDKQPGKWCQHCIAGRGCQIYESRPQSCRDYACMWLQSQDKTYWGDEMRPNRARAIYTEDSAKRVTITVDPARRDAWRHPPNARIVRMLVALGITVLIDCGQHSLIVTRAPNGGLKVMEAKQA